MNKNTYQFISILILFVITLNCSIYAQEQEGVPEHMKYFRESYEETYATNFDNALNAVKKFIENEGFRVLNANVKDNDNGTKRAVVQSEICVITQDPDSVFQHIKMNASRPPFIRGGVWSSARVKYRFIINDKGDGSISITSRLEYDGWESYITNAPHSFVSSGLLEFTAFEKIKQLIDSN